MSNAWDDASRLADEHSGNFVRLSNDGDSIIGAFCGEPHTRKVHWTGEKTEDCTGDNCQLCQSGKPGLRISLNFYVPAKKSMLVFEQGPTWFKNVLQVKEKYGLNKKLFEIRRNGRPGDPKTSYSILPDVDITPELQQEISAVKLNDLGGQPKPAAQVADGPTISMDEAKGLRDALQLHPKEEIQTFMDKFGIVRLGELQRAALPQAWEYLDGLEGDQIPF